MAPKSSTEYYPTGRDVIISEKSADQWLRSKRIDDNLGPRTWRVHNNLYNLTEFAKKVFNLYTIKQLQDSVSPLPLG